MKYFLFVIAACAFFSNTNAYSPRDANEIIDRVKTAIEKIFSEIPDPWNIASANLTIPENEFISGEFDIITAQFTGMSKFEIKTLNYDAAKFRFDFDVNMPGVTAETATSLNLKGLINISEHEVEMKSTTTNFGVHGHATMNANHDQVTDFSILMSVGQMTFDITGFMNNPVMSKFISSYLTENAAKSINTMATMFSPFISTAIEDVANFILRIMH